MPCIGSPTLDLRTFKGPPRTNYSMAAKITMPYNNESKKRIIGSKGTSLLECLRSSYTEPGRNVHQQKYYKMKNRRKLTFSLAVVKSCLVTRILRSLKANNPASVQTALISAPDRSSFAKMNSSRSTSSLKLIREV